MILKTNLLLLWGTLHGVPFHHSDFGKVVTGVLPVLHNAFVAGGSVRRALLGHPPGRDIDVFFTHAEAASSFVDRLKKEGFKEDTDNRTNRRRKFKKGWCGQHVVVDCVVGQFFDTPEDLLEDFDFTCCCFATNGADLWVDPVGLLDAERKYLRVNNADKLERSLHHAERYMREGFTAEAAVMDELLKYGKEEREKKKPEYSGK